MDGLGFAATAVSSTGMIGGLVSLPLPPGVGWLSDRMERRPLLILGYLLGLSSPIVLLVSSALWHFWIAVILHYVSLGIINAVAPALVADVVPAETLGRAMSRFSATLWMGGIFGFAGTDYAIQRLGLDLTFVLGACLSFVATVLVAVLPLNRASIRGIIDT